MVKISSGVLEGVKSDHLLLLVGGNPLPNAVAGKLLAGSGGRITLVHSKSSAHSKGTAEVAQRLRTWMTEQKIVAERGSIELKEVEESSATSIVQGVQERLKAFNAQSVGLNYTGGTKVMSVHAYRAVEQLAGGNGVTPVFSYLDARTLEMVFDPVDAGSSEQREYLGRKVKMGLKDLLELHGWSFKYPPNEIPILPKGAGALARAFAGDEQAMQIWKDWISNTHQPEISDLPSDGLLNQVKQTLSSEVYQVAKPEDWMGWLKGKWLEHHVLDELSKLAGTLYLHENGQNIVPNEVEFDLDVVALRGYQLFAFSCSTDTDRVQGGRGRLKLKLFEAYVRARQLGGDEARVALVCCSNDPEGLQHEMQRDIDPEGRIRVFGRRHLADLATYLAQWIQSQSGEEG